MANRITRRAHRLLPLLAVTAVVAFPATASAATHQLGTTTPGGAWGCPGADFKYGNEYTLSETGTVSKITGWMKGNGGSGSQSFRAMIYAADGAGGAPGTLLATSSTVSVSGTAAEGAVDFPISPGVTLAPGSYWITQQSGGDSGQACLSGTSGGQNDYNTDLFADGPSNLFDASAPISTSTDVWTLYATYDTAAADTTPPTITASAAPAPNANGWNNTDVTVTFNCVDSGSGVDTVTPPVTLSSEGAGQSVTGTCKDKAGNSATVTQSGIQIDKTAPSVAYSGNAGTYAADQSVNITCAASDALSGLASSTCANVTGPAYSFGPGTHTVTATATDKAGNTKTASVTFTVTVSPGSLCNVTTQFVQSSPRYQALNARQRRAADALSDVACDAVARFASRPSGPQQQAMVHVYDVLVGTLAREGWLTSSQADTLTGLAGAL